MTIQTSVDNIDSVETLGGFIGEACSEKGSYFDYIPSLPSLTDSLCNKLQEIRKAAENNENLRELSKRINSYIEQLRLFQIAANSSEMQGQLVNTLLNTLSSFKEKLDAPIDGQDIEDEFELITPDSDKEEGQAQSSTLYSLYDGAWDASRTASQKMLSYVWGQTLTDVIKNPEKIPENHLATIKSLIENNGGRLTSREVADFINALNCSKAYAQQAEFLAMALCNKQTIEGRRPSESMRSFLNNHHVIRNMEETGTPHVDLAFIPFVFKGSDLLGMVPYVETGHIILITVCFSKKTVEYYDSFAQPPETWKCYEGFCMKKELEIIKTLCFGEAEGKILTSTTKQQHDWHSCGVFIIWYIIQRLNKAPFEEIASKEVTAEDIESIRTKLAKILASPKKLNKKIALSEIYSF